MERTRLKPGERELVPAATETLVAAEAREQTPTLMAGESPGSQGAVQVWEPVRWRLWPPAIAWTLLILLELSLLLFNWLHGGDPLQVIQGGLYLLFFVIAAVAAYATLRRPCYLSTDDAGIGIRLAGGGTRVLRWRDIIAMERNWSTLILVTVGEPGKTSLYLTGYPRSVRREIEEVIIDRAGLVYNQFTRQACWYSTGNPAGERKCVKAPTESKRLGSGD